MLLQRAQDAVQMAKSIAGGTRGRNPCGVTRHHWRSNFCPRAAEMLFKSPTQTWRVRLHDLSTQEMLGGLKDGKLHVALIVQVPPKVFGGIGF